MRWLLIFYAVALFAAICHFMAVEHKGWSHVLESVGLFFGLSTIPTAAVLSGVAL